MRFIHIAVALVLLGGITLPAQAQVKVLELGHEAEPRMIRMPDRAAGELTLQSCPTCRVLRLRASAETKYVLDGQLVTLREMSKYFESNPEANVVVMQLKGSTALSRVIVHVKRAKRQ